MKQVIRGLYYYYSYGATADIAYFKTLGVLVLAIFLHFMHIRIALLKYASIEVNLPFTSESRFVRYLVILLLMVPVYLVLRKLLPENYLKEHSLSQKQLVRGRNIFLLYVIASIAILIALVWESIKWK